MFLPTPLLVSQQLLATLGTRLFRYYEDRIPQTGPLLVVSNHRSFMDAPVLMAAIDRPIRFACHHYMGQVPVLREIVTRLGCFPLDVPEQRQQSFFHQAVRLLQNQQVVGVFPEGAPPMVNYIEPQGITPFQRGFAHLALRAPLSSLAVLPVAIASHQENTDYSFPLQWLHWVDPSEPLFKESGSHPMVVYQRVNVMIGRPVWITETQRQNYQGKQARSMVADLTEHCHAEISDLLKQFYS